MNPIERWSAYRPTKEHLLWTAVAAVIATVVLGFSAGGWVTGGTAKKMADQAAEASHDQLAAAYFPAQSEATALMSANPNLKCIMAICSPAVPGAAEAVKQAGKSGKVKVLGLGLPNENKLYVNGGVTDSVILWNTGDLGYLTVYAAVALAKGELKPGDTSIKAGDLGTFEIKGDNILLGKPYIFNKDNINKFDF